MSKPSTLNLGVIGAGRWGPNLIRNFQIHENTNLKWVCDRDPVRLEEISNHYEGIKTTDQWTDVVSDPTIDAVVVCTPTASHYELVKAAILAGKHVFVEKPLTTVYVQAVELVALAKERNLKLMVGHVFLFNQAVREIKRILASGELGKLNYLYSTRTNLGPIRADVNALWDLAPHDVSVLLYLLGSQPDFVQGFGGSYINEPVEDVAFGWMRFPGGVVANLHVSWLDPKKVRQLVIVGSEKMLIFDDLAENPIKVLDKNVDKSVSEIIVADTIHHFRKSIVEGSVVEPDVKTGEPLKNECDAFVRWVLFDEPQPSTPELSAEVVRVLEEMNFSMQHKGVSKAPELPSAGKASDTLDTHLS